MRILVVLAVLAACGKTKTESKQLENQAAVPVIKPQPAPPEPIAPEELVKAFRACWDAWNAQTWREVEACFTATAVSDAPGSRGAEAKGAAAIVESLKPFHAAFPDATGKPELVMVNGNRLIAIVHLRGKHDGVWKVDGRELAPTHKQTSVYLAEVLEYDDKAKVTRRSDYFDLATVLGQLEPPKQRDVRGAMDRPFMIEHVAIAADSHQKANVATVKQLVARFGKHDATLGELLADGLAWSEQPAAKDLDRRGAIARISELWNAFSDGKLALDGSLAAGEYVAAFETFEGTNDGDLPWLRLKKTGKRVSLPVLAIYKLDHDKVAAAWMFYQSSALLEALGKS